MHRQVLELRQRVLGCVVQPRGSGVAGRVFPVTRARVCVLPCACFRVLPCARVRPVLLVLEL